MLVYKNINPHIFAGYSELVDVTVPVQCLVESGRLTFYDGSKADLAGFYDPCALLHDEQKHLLIRYFYQNVIHQVLLPDEDALKVPKTGIPFIRKKSRNVKIFLAVQSII